MTSAIELRPAFSFTHHAIARFMSRVWPTISSRSCADAREALHVLVDAAPRAEVMARRSSMGDAMWSVTEPPMRWITKPGTFRGRRVAVVVTVLDGTEDVEAEKAAERDVLEAHRRLEAVPGIGTPESTSPPPGPLDGAELKAYRGWLDVERTRLAVELERLKATARLDGDVAELIREHTAALRAELYRQAQAQRSRLDAKQRAIDARNAVLLEAADALEAQDSARTSELRGRMRKLAGG